ncbi:unnamed protein product [Ceutorhynchus assimilis]|uniref:PARP catalytic domain-containing protein n=1 Tax=Ceutorhynchus assimilis TaxID=467358 RepID=A0A9P0DDD6_9CUCU|nr:unnamed protein product [Ceutorhynchus assimilis]
MASWEETLAQLAALSPLLENLNISSECFEKNNRKPKKKEDPAGTSASKNSFLKAIERAGNHSLNSGSTLDIDKNKNEASSNQFQLPQPKQIFIDHSILQLNNEPIVNVLKYKIVENGSKKFKKISARFPPSLSVLKIREVQNPFLKKSFQLTQHFKYSNLQPMQLFHGTKSKYVKSICSDNFNWRFTGLERGHKNGKGVNFTPKPLFAERFCDRDDANLKVMILADVLVKNKCLGDENLAVPPPGYDTAIRKDSIVFVKFSDAEFYPKYIIYFKKVKKNPQ